MPIDLEAQRLLLWLRMGDLVDSEVVGNEKSMDLGSKEEVNGEGTDCHGDASQRLQVVLPRHGLGPRSS